MQEQRGRVARDVEMGHDAAGQRHGLIPADGRERQHVGTRLDGALVGVLEKGAERIDERRGHEVLGIVQPGDMLALARSGHERAAIGVDGCTGGIGKVEAQLGRTGRWPAWATPASRRGGGASARAGRRPDRPCRSGRHRRSRARARCSARASARARRRAARGPPTQESAPARSGSSRDPSSRRAGTGKEPSRDSGRAPRNPACEAA